MQRIAPMFPVYRLLATYSRGCVTKYLSLIEKQKQGDSAVIASVKCISAHEWKSFAKRFEQAGADALELNVLYCFDSFAQPRYEKSQFDIESRQKQVSIRFAENQPLLANLRNL
jgi:dihydroorotate dehydrogenase (fumarate)